jgi:subtilisin family serine protease
LYDDDNDVMGDALYSYHGAYISSVIFKIADRAKVLPVKFLRGTIGTAEDAVAALQYAIDRGAEIINCSWNFKEFDQDMFNIIKNNPDVLFVCAAGNVNINLDMEPLYPCSFNLDNIIKFPSLLCHFEFFKKKEQH